MNTKMLLTSDNLTKIIDLKQLSLLETEFIELYGVTCYNHTSEDNITFILQNIFFCDDCETNHLLISLVNYYGQYIEFTFDVSSIENHGKGVIYQHKDEMQFMYYGNRFAYDPLSKNLEIWDA